MAADRLSDFRVPDLLLPGVRFPLLRFLTALAFLATVFFAPPGSAASPTGGGTISTGYSCKKVNDDSGRWACQCSGIEDCDRMKQKECIASTIRCGQNGCYCTQARRGQTGTKRPEVSPTRPPAATAK